MGTKTVSSKEVESNASIIQGVIKGSLFAVSVSLVAILLFAFIIKLTSLSLAFVDPVNEAIKGISILMGCFYAFKSASSNGLIKGILIGVFYIILSFFIFSILNGQLSFNKSFINDLLFGGIIGAICGIIAVNVKR
ncbi:MAG: TIGR04086 family membrane protein [Clostridia bacterium]|nr:TIGR04086 family membrane protein [Clostridia bacterium]